MNVEEGLRCLLCPDIHQVFCSRNKLTMMNLPWMGSSKDGEYEEKNRVSSYRGYLLKMRRSHNLLAPQWGKRWFSIEGRFLRWYRLESDLNFSGMIDLRHVRSITKVDINGAFTFCVTSEDRNLIMRANSLLEMNGWIRALHIRADLARGGSGMNVVSDYNEVPLQMQGIKKSSKLRSSLTLEQELDRNLRALNDLELGLTNASEEMSPSADRYSREMESKYDDDKEDVDDVLSNLQQFAFNGTAQRSKAGKKRNTNQNRNPIAEPPSSTHQPSPPVRVSAGNGRARADSEESLENIPMSGVNNPRNYVRAYHSTESAAVVNKNASSAAASAHRKQRVGTEAGAGTRSGSDLSDEFDHSYGSEFDLADIAVRHKHTAPLASAPAAKAHSINMNRAAKSKLHSVSSDSIDSVEFSYIPDISDDVTSPPNRNNKYTTAGRSKQDRDDKFNEIGLRNSAAKAAWN